MKQNREPDGSKASNCCCSKWIGMAAILAWHWPWQEQPHQAFHEYSTHEGNPELMQG